MSLCPKKLYSREMNELVLFDRFAMILSYVQKFDRFFCFFGDRAGSVT